MNHLYLSVRTRVFLGKIAIEYDAAVKKHPKFCDKITENDLRLVEEKRRFYQKQNDENSESGRSTALGIMLEEVYEFVEAYLQGDFDNAAQELAQVAAVALRTMEAVQDEKIGSRLKGVENGTIR